MHSSSLNSMLKLQKTSPQKLFPSDCITLYFIVCLLYLFIALLFTSHFAILLNICKNIILQIYLFYLKLFFINIWKRLFRFFGRSRLCCLINLFSLSLLSMNHKICIFKKYCFNFFFLHMSPLTLNKLIFNLYWSIS